MSSSNSTLNRAWWKESTVYQIYPASFKDSNGDGVGDVPGITSKLDYLKTLGVDIIWVSPIYKSPQVDMGYDVEDYKEIHKPYGTVADVEALIKGAHDRGMKLVMDLVVNHSSDQHKWFKEALKGKDNPYRDYYMWKKPKYDADGNRQPPNNWLACWGGSAWQYDEASDEYFLHLFAPEQPDLNWENPELRAAVHDIMHFWLKKGVDGFRMDVINFISKVPGLPDAEVVRHDQPWQPGEKYFACGPRLHEYLKDLGAILKQYDAFSVGEMPFVYDPREIINAVGYHRGELNMIFSFEHVDVDHGKLGKFSPREWKLRELKDVTKKWQSFMLKNDGWNALYLENHDQPRSITRFASDSPEYRVHSSTLLATFLALQSGTLFIYQGQELGMINIEKSRPVSEYKDLEVVNAWAEMLEKHPNDLALQADLAREIQRKSRDNARTPMQWDSSTHAGFSSVQPWQKVNAVYPEINAEAQVGKAGSPFEYWAAILKLKKKHKDVFIYGDFELLDEENDDVFTYTRSYGEEKALVVCNFKGTQVQWKIPSGLKLKEAGMLIQNYQGLDATEGGVLNLRPYEALVSFVEWS